ncbi:MAG: AMP nucleosidase [Chlamydiae bacterium CG10_big_fil_rev_8_21_14_0_10_35_9]|nr:MAG: AMP nucleosidase [Chlamydiae bacterium CG10_big_fil_rev_8_21_14_0_10_35_9]
MSPIEEQIAKETLERYSGSDAKEFQSNLILTNFPRYVQYFAESRNVPIKEGSVFKVAHCKEEDVSILDFKIGSPAAALTVDTCSFLSFKSAIFLGMCGGLRRRYQIGDYLVPVASIRAEGTSDYYFPIEVPALANFLMQKAVTDVLEEEKTPYHIGITYTTNMRFWEFNVPFAERLKATRAQGIEMECATLFTGSYKRKFTLGALLLISDLPLEKAKTKKDAAMVFDKFTKDHVEKGIKILKVSRKMQEKKIKGAYHRNVDSPSSEED